MLMSIDWHHLFVPTESLAELIIRGSMMYLLLFAALRILGRRHVGSLSMMDLLLMVLIADAAQNAMADEYKSITEGLILCGTLLGWNYLLDWLAFMFPAVERILEPPPLPIIRHGKFIRKNLKAELLTKEEVMGQLREQEVFDLADVEYAYVESDGGLSIKKVAGSQESGSQQNKKSSLR
jgi:uncharacterized membrane protein YcaP (DUF421 family)